jgi:membrane protease YdiL (CAAX protease family)
MARACQRTRRGGTGRLTPVPLVDQVDWVNLAGMYHVLVFAVLVPFLAIRGRQKLLKADAPPINRLKHFKATTLMLVLFGALSLVTARSQHLSLFHAELRPLLVSVPAAILFYGVAVIAARPRWRKAVISRKRVVQLFMPQTAAERNWWLLVSVLAGASEEITWRGVQSSLVAHLVGSPWLGVVLCALMFGAAHLTQGWKSAGIISLFAFGFQLLVWLSGSLYIPMLVHAAYDITAGLTYRKFGREYGDGGQLWKTPTL